MTRTLLALACLLCVALAGCGGDDDDGGGGGYALNVSPDDFGDGVLHPYLPLQPGSAWVYETEAGEAADAGDARTTTVEVLQQTRDVNGVAATAVRTTTTRDGTVVGEREHWYAQDGDGTVWLLGEQTTVGPGASWSWGVDGARPGIAMPADPQPGGGAYHRSYHPGEAEDRAEVVDVGRRVEVPLGTFEDTVTTREWSDLEPGAGETVHHTRGIGILRREPEGDGPAEVLASYAPG